ncbi:MAG: DUF4160 domain-containing protein [Eubacterium sp.]|nr:DUF4160 domain-containing protein [Eubacterium sp.]
MPEEPIHVHLAEETPASNATKLWITRNGKTLLANNNSRIKDGELRLIQRIIEANSSDILQAWKEHFETLRYYC